MEHSLKNNLEKTLEFYTDKEKALERWKRLGLLEGLTDEVALKTALHMEKMARICVVEKSIDVKDEYHEKLSTLVFPIVRHLCDVDNFKTFNCSKLYNITQYSFINNTIFFEYLKKNEFIKEIDEEAEIVVLICETLKKYPEIIDGVME